MRLMQRNGMWCVEFRLIDGTRKRLSTGVPLSAEKSLAEDAAKKIVADQLTANEVDTLAQAFERTYREKWAGSKSGVVMRHMVNVLTRDIGKWRLRDVNYARLKDYCETLKEEGLAPATINRRMSAVGVAMRECSRRDPTLARPDMPHFTENNKKERYMTEDEDIAVNTWLKNKAAADAYGTPGTGEWTFMRCLYRVLLDTGMRFSETFIAVEEKGVLRLRHGDTKSGKARSIPLTSRALTCWQAMTERSTIYRKLRDDPNAWAWVDHRWKQAVAGICPDVTLHTLRHTCASRLIQRGVDLFTVSKWLGHSSVKVTERYAHLAPESLSGALSALERGPVGVPSIKPEENYERVSQG